MSLLGQVTTERVTELSVGWFYSPLGFYWFITQKPKKYLGSPFTAGDVFYSNYFLICPPFFNAIHNSLFWIAVVSHSDCTPITSSSSIEKGFYFSLSCIDVKGNKTYFFHCKDKSYDKAITYPFSHPVYSTVFQSASSWRSSCINRVHEAQWLKGAHNDTNW